MAGEKQQLQQMISDLETKQFRDGEAKGLVETIGGEIKKQLAPLFESLAKDLTGNVSKSVADAIKGLNVDVPQVNMPAFPEFPKIPEFPKMKAPVVNVPAPVVNIPAPIVHVAPATVTFPSEMSLKRGEKPFPVVMMDIGGKPMQFPQMSMGASGGKADFFTILGIQNTVGVVTINPDGQAIYTSAASGSATSTQLVDSSNNVYSAANPLPTTATISLPAGQGDAATATRVVIAGNSDASVVVNSGTITTVTTLTGITNSVAVVALDRDGNPLTTGPIGAGDGSTALRVLIAGDSPSSVVVNSGTITTVSTVTGITNSVAVVQLDRDGNPQTQNSIAQGDAASALRVVIAGNSDASVVVNSGTITTVTTLTGITNTVSVRLDSPDGIYSGTNPLPIATVGGGPDSMFVHVAHTAFPTAVADGADVRAMADKLGRTVMRPVQVRELLSTASASVTTGAETTLVPAVAGKYLDLISVIIANDSTAAIKVQLRAVTGGNVIQTFQVPAAATSGWTPPVPWPQDATGNNWTFQNPGSDQSNTTITLTALFSQEV